MLQRSLVDTFRDDFAKYASQSQLVRLHVLFDAIPQWVGRKAIYSKMVPEGVSATVRTHLELLIRAGIGERGCSGGTVCGARAPDGAHKLSRPRPLLLAPGQEKRKRRGGFRRIPWRCGHPGGSESRSIGSAEVAPSVCPPEAPAIRREVRPQSSVRADGRCPHHASRRCQLYRRAGIGLVSPDLLAALFCR